MFEKLSGFPLHRHIIADAMVALNSFHPEVLELKQYKEGSNLSIKTLISSKNINSSNQIKNQNEIHSRNHQYFF
jgi:hypothetical protein